MSESNRETLYRAALDAAHADLNQVLESIAHLRSRMELIEGAINALKPVVETLNQVELNQAVPSTELKPVLVAHEQTAQAPASDADPNSEPFDLEAYRAHPVVEHSTDSLQEHINQALGMLAIA